MPSETPKGGEKTECFVYYDELRVTNLKAGLKPAFLEIWFLKAKYEMVSKVKYISVMLSKIPPAFSRDTWWLGYRSDPFLTDCQ